MTEVDIEDALTSDHEEYKAVKEVGASGMSEVAIVVVRDIGHVQDVQLRLSTTASGVDWKEDRPGDAHANEAAHDRDLEEAQQKISIESVMVQNVGIR